MTIEHYFVPLTNSNACGYADCSLGVLDHPKPPKHNASRDESKANDDSQTTNVPDHGQAHLPESSESPALVVNEEDQKVG